MLLINRAILNLKEFLNSSKNEKTVVYGFQQEERVTWTDFVWEQYQKGNVETCFQNSFQIKYTYVL